MPKLLLNVSKVTTTPNLKVTVGVQPYTKEALELARAEHRNNYLIKRGGTDGLSIIAVPLKADLPPLGTSTEEQELAVSPWLLAPLTIEALTTLFQAIDRPILKWRPLRVLSAQPDNILPPNDQLPAWLQRRLVLNFETRTVKLNDKQSAVVLACGVGTRNIIGATCAELLATNFPLFGKYVSVLRESRDERVSDYLQLSGRVKGIKGSKLQLEDHGDRPSSVEASEAYLDPHRGNFVACLNHYLGEVAASRDFAKADATASSLLGGCERLKLIGRTFEYIGRKQIELAPGAPLQLGPMAGTTRESWMFRASTIEKPVLVFDPSGTRTGRWAEGGLDQNGPYDQRTFTPKQLRISVVCQAVHEGQVEGFIAKFLDGMPDVKTGRGDRQRVPYAKGFIRRYALEAPKIRIFVAKSASLEDYSAACREAVEAATDGGFEWNLAIVQIDKDFKELEDPRNPYFGVKAFFLKHRVPVQEITLETMQFADEQLVFAMNNMSVATYSKVGGIPWLLKAQPTVAHELVVGIGSQTLSNSRLGAQERVVGITTLFSSDGKYLLDDRTGAVPFAQYKEELKKSLVRSIDSVRTTDNWRSTDAVRLIFHVFKQMADAEADAVAEVVSGLGLTQVKFAFVHLVDSHPFAVFDDLQKGFRTWDGTRGEKVPDRGVAISIADGENILCLTGPRDIKQARHGVPQPMLLRLHRRSTFRDMTYLTRQVFDFSCHSWRMFTPAPTPITIHYSELIARLLSGLRHVPAWDADTMLGPISRTRWFL